MQFSQPLISKPLDESSRSIKDVLFRRLCFSCKTCIFPPRFDCSRFCAYRHRQRPEYLWQKLVAATGGKKLIFAHIRESVIRSKWHLVREKNKKNYHSSSIRARSKKPRFISSNWLSWGKRCRMHSSDSECDIWFVGCLITGEVNTFSRRRVCPNCRWGKKKPPRDHRGKRKKWRIMQKNVVIKFGMH